MDNPDALQTILAALAATGELTEEDLRPVLEETATKEIACNGFPLYGMMTDMDYFIVANSFAAPFFSDTSTKFVEASSPREALEAFAASYKHPCGLYSAVAFKDANAREKGEKPLAQWMCNHEAEKQAITKKLAGGYIYRGNSPGEFEINGEIHVVTDPKGGRVVEA